MRILYNNLIPDYTTISSSGALANYPVNNVYDKILIKRMQSDDDSDTITITWDTEQTANCLFFGYTTANSLSITLKDGGGSTVYTGSTTSMLDNNAIYFGASFDFYSAEITITTDKINFIWSDGNNFVWEDGNNAAFYGLDALYLGGLSLGVYYEAPQYNSNITIPLDYRAVKNKTSGGQLTGTKITKLRAVEFTLSGITSTQKDDVDTFLDDVSLVNTFWVDVWPESIGDFQPMYSNIEEVGGYSRRSVNGLLFDIAITFQECR